MKKILLALAVITNIHAFDPSQDDKIMHMGVSTITGMAGTAICYREYKLTEAQSFWCGVGTSLFIGGLKEWYDYNNGGTADWEDMQANLVGGLMGSGFLYFNYKYNF